MANKGNVLNMGDVLYEGDYLESDHMPCGFFRATLIEYGQLDVRWHISDSDTNGWPIWNSTLKSADSFFAIMQADGNLCIYNGTPDNNRGLLYAMSDRSAPVGPGNKYYAMMQGDGNLTLNGPNGFMTGTMAWVQDQGLAYVKSCANGTDKEDLQLSSAAANTGPADTVSVQTIDVSSDRQWRVVYVFDHSTFVYFVLIDQKTHRVAGADQIQRNSFIRLFDHILSNCRWLVVPNGDGRLPASLVGIKSLTGDQYFNVPGNGPYNAGQAVVLYDWVKTSDKYPYPNLLWEMVKVAKLAEAPAAV